MRHLAVFILFFVLLGNAYAVELGQQPPTFKDNSHVGRNPGTPDGRQGGETIADAVVIPGLPFMDTGNTSDNIDDYGVFCPWGDSTSPEVVYSFLPAEDLILRVDLCGSGYDTQTYIFDADFNLIECNEDYYYDEICGYYTSLIEEAFLVAGVTYFIFVDGWAGDSGDYILNVEEFVPPPPCFLTCDGVGEGEPALHDGYVDTFNTGCNDESGVFPFQDLVGDENGELVFCGKAGWHLNDAGSQFRDTDWFTAVIGGYGMIEWTLDAEEETNGFLLSPQDCATVGLEMDMTAGPCAPVMMVIQGNPGDILWLWAGSSDYSPPSGFVGHEYNYICTFVGLQEGIVSTDNLSLGGLKSLFR